MEKDIKRLYIGFICLCIAGIIACFEGMQIAKEIHNIKKKINDIIFETEYDEFVLEENEKEGIR